MLLFNTIMNEIDLGQLGKQRFFNFCNTIKNLISDEAVKVDLVVASGNSGLAVGKFTEMIYEELGLSFPKKLSIPFYRFLPGYHDDLSKIFNSEIFLPDVVKQLKNIDNLENVLFVDDEIGQGVTAIGIFKLINQALEKLGRIKIKNFYIVAEDQGFKPPKDLPQIKFIPYDKELDGYNNVIFFVNPEELEAPIVKVMGDDDKFPFHQRTNILLNLPVKYFNKGNPVYTEKYLELAKQKILNLAELQNKYIKHLKDLIENCLE